MTKINKNGQVEFIFEELDFDGAIDQLIQEREIWKKDYRFSTDFEETEFFASRVSLCNQIIKNIELLKGDYYA